jgi:multidrug efflux pump subunit AcrB
MKKIVIKKKKHTSPFKILILFIVCSLLGFLVIPKLSVRLNPSQSLPSITVGYSWPKASPHNLEREITTKLEGGFNVIKGITNISSKSSKGNGYITLEFDKYTDIDVARFEVATVIRQLYKKLPEKTSYPIVTLNSPKDNENERAFLSYSINAPFSPFLIQETVKNSIEPQISAITGIDKTTIYGARPQEYVITYTTSLLQSLSINKEDIGTAIKQAFNRNSLGEVLYHNSYITLSLHSKSKILWHIPIKKVANRIIYLDDIAQIKKATQEATSYYRVNGKNSITLSLFATKNANTIVLAKEVRKKLQEIKEQLPNNYSLVESYNATEYLQTELNKIYERSGYTVLILLVFILIASKSIRYLIITISSLLANLGIAFLLYYAFNVEIQLYSLAGITISLGLIIDNSIVMIDHIKKQGNSKVIIPILASTLTTIGALSIIYFLDEKYKVNLIDFALVIIINLVVSLWVALFLIPALLYKIPLKEKKQKKQSIRFQTFFHKSYSKLVENLLRFKKIAITFIILVFGIPFFLLPQKMEENSTFLEKAYNTTFGNEWYRENLRSHVDTYLGGTFRLFSNYVFENAFYGKNEETKLYVTAAMEKGATVHQMNEAFLELESFVQQFKEIKQFTSTISSSNDAKMEIIFIGGYKESSFPYILKSKLVRKVIDLGGIDWQVYGVGSGFNNGGGSNDPINFTVEAKGYNYNTLNNWADTLKVALQKHPRIQHVLVKENSYFTRKPSYEYQFNLNKEKLSLANSNSSRVFNQLKNLTLSKQSDISLNVNGKYMPIRLTSGNSKKFNIWAIKNTPIDSLNNPLVLRNIANIIQIREEENIYKENQEYIRLVQFQYTGSAKFGANFLDEKIKELQAKLPLGYQFEKAGNNLFLNDDKNNNYFFLLALVLLIIYFICAILFESLKQPFIILSVIPISFIGVFLTFYLFDFNFDQGGLASFVLLSGITVNASIFIINGFNKLKKEEPNKNSLEIYIEAFNQKIFPITLTIISTILGFIPFVKDGQNEVFWFALGAGTIGGLLFSLVGILFYLPLFTLKKAR